MAFTLISIPLNRIGPEVSPVNLQRYNTSMHKVSLSIVTEYSTYTVPETLRRSPGEITPGRRRHSRPRELTRRGGCESE